MDTVDQTIFKFYQWVVLVRPRRIRLVVCAFLLGDYAHGKDTGIIDQTNLADVVGETESHIRRKIRTLVLTRKEHGQLRPVLNQRPLLPLWVSQEAPQQQVAAA